MENTLIAQLILPSLISFAYNLFFKLTDISRVGHRNHNYRILQVRFSYRILKINRGNLHSVAAKLLFKWSVLLSVTFKSLMFQNCLTQISHLSKGTFLCYLHLSLSAVSCNTNMVKMHGKFMQETWLSMATQTPLSDFPWGERTTVHSLQKLKCAFVFY